MTSCKDVREPACGSRRNIMKLVLERTNYEVGSMCVGAGLYMYDVVVKSSRSLSHLLMSSCFQSYEHICSATFLMNHIVCSFRSFVSDLQYFVLFRCYKTWKRRSRRNLGAKFAIFRPWKCRGYTDLCCKITPNSDIVAMFPRGGVFRPRILEREKINNNK